MNSSSELLSRISRLARDPGFAAIVAFDYYDGPKRGLALFESGEAVRFESLGDSKSRLFRAFELVPIEGNWWPRVRALQQAEDAHPLRRILVPSKSSDVLAKLEEDTRHANALGQFLGVGSPNLESILISSLTSQQLENVRKLGCSPAGFELAHKICRSGAAKSSS